MLELTYSSRGTRRGRAGRRTRSSSSRRSTARRPTSAGPRSRRCRVCEGADLELTIQRRGAFPDVVVLAAAVLGQRQPVAFLWEVQDGIPSVAGGDARRAQVRPARAGREARPPDGVHREGLHRDARRGHQHHQARRLSRWPTRRRSRSGARSSTSSVHGTERTGLALQRRLPGVCADVLSPALESALGAVRPRRRSPGRSNVWRSTCRASPSTSSSRAGRRRPTGGRGLPPPPSRRCRRRSRTARSAATCAAHRSAETVDEALVVFLRTGRLPWSFRVPPARGSRRLVLDAWSATDADRGPPPAHAGRVCRGAGRPERANAPPAAVHPAFVEPAAPRRVAAAGDDVEEVLTALDRARHRRPLAAAFTRRRVGRRARRRRRRAAGPDRPSSLGRRGEQSPLVDREDRTLAAALERALARRHREPDAPPAGDGRRAPPPTPASTAVTATHVGAPSPMRRRPQTRRGHRRAPRRQRRRRSPAPVPAPRSSRASGSPTATSWSNPTGRCACSTTSRPAS